jgi:hypothetical protein
MKKPPDQVRNFITVKVPLRKVLKNWNLVKPKFDQAILKINQFATRTYEFLNMYILWRFQQNKQLPKIDKSLILRIFNLIGQRSSKGRKSKVVQDDIQEFYQTHFEPIYPLKIDKINLTYPLALLSEEIIKCLETNIRTHFIDYCNKYINIVHKNPRQKIIKESKKSRVEKKVEYSEITNNLAYDVKIDPQRYLLPSLIINKKIE